MSEPEPDSIISIAPVESIVAEASPEAETVKAEAEAGEAEEDTTVATPAPSNANRLSKAENKTITGILERLTLYKDGEDNEIMDSFQRLVSRKSLPDYFEVIKEPVAFSTIRAKVIKKQYKNFREFVKDMAQIAHNAQVYNRPSSQIFQDADTLRSLFKAELQKLLDAKFIEPDVAELPYLGELPDFEDSPIPDPQEEEEEAEADDDEDEEDEDEEDDVTDDDRPRKKRGARGRRASGTVRKPDISEKEDPDAMKKRGRPPKVMTPMESRINNILKGLRKSKNGSELLILPFERLPDKAAMPEYYQEIKNPIAMDLIKKKAKRKKYQSVDQVVKDLELLFDNAKSYNLPTSDIYKAADQLLKEAHELSEQEKKKPDSDFVDEDGKLPVKEILYNGELWKVGDWVHISNLNDVTKPIVAQIYRTWQDSEGQKWINACWYYRPEQTVHRYEKHFFDNEVVKTGQYRDHKIEEVTDRCFVMFFTRYNKGRPRGLPSDKEVYVCEARYNEEKFKLNKIKTWASCVPDEVRDKDYEMDLFEVPRKMKKYPSPIKHLLREDAKEDDPLPKPTWGAANAPPIVGAVHKRPREGNESPPPEPTPPPPERQPTPVIQPTPTPRPYNEAGGDILMSGMSNRASVPLPSPSSNQGSSNNHYGQQYAARPSASPAPNLHTQTSYGSQTSNMHSSTTQNSHYASSQNQQGYSQNYSVSTPVSNNIPNYNYQQHSHTAPRPVAQSSGSHSSGINVYNPPRQVEVYTLSDQANASIPPDIRDQFHRDEYGRVMFYTAPPLATNPIPEEQQTLGHSLRYLADKARNKEEDERKRKARVIELETEASERLKRLKSDTESKKLSILEQKVDALGEWCINMDNGTDEIYKQMYGNDWKDIRDLDKANLVEKQLTASKRQREVEKYQRERKARKDVPITGFKWV